MISSILFSIYVVFVLTAAVVTNPVTLGILFSFFVIFVLQSVFLTSPVVLGIFLPTSSIFFSRPCLTKSYCVLVTNLLVFGILVSIALSFWQHHYPLLYLAYLNQQEQYFFYQYPSYLL